MARVLSFIKKEEKNTREQNECEHRRTLGMTSYKYYENDVMQTL